MSKGRKERILQHVLDNLVEKIKRERGKIDSARDINNGLCEMFMMRVREEFPLAEERSTATQFEGAGPPWPNHVWVYFQGKHYDSETTEGIRDWRNLPLFKRSSVEDVKTVKVNKWSKKWVWDETTQLYNLSQ